MITKRTLLFLLFSALFSTTLWSSDNGVIQGQLVPVSQVKFEVIDGFAFQNYIKVYVKDLHVGNYMGPMGTKEVEFKEKVKLLEQRSLVQGGNYYLPIKDRTVRGEKIVEKIVHFPEAQRVQGESSDLAACENQLRELENRTSLIYQESLKVSRPLEQLLQQMQSRTQTLGENEMVEEHEKSDLKRSPTQSSVD